MAVETKKIFTGSVVASTLSIDATYGFVEISIMMTAGTGTITGSAVTPNGIVSTSLPLTLNQAIQIGAGSNTLLDGITITTTGTVLIIAR